MTSPRAAVIFNPAKKNQLSLKDAVASAESEYGYAPTLWLETSKDDPGHQMVREAIAAGVDVIVAAGGDGTVRAVAHELADYARRADGKPVPDMSIVPIGTGNVLARNLEIPLALWRAVRIAFDGVPHPTDAGLARYCPEGSEPCEEIYMIMAGVGIDAQMVVNTNEKMKKHAGVLAYAEAVMKSLGGGNRLGVTMVRDGQEAERSNVHTLMVGNCGELPGKFVVLPDASPDDGKLDIVAIRKKGVFGWFKVLATLMINIVRWMWRRVSSHSRQITTKDRNREWLQYSSARSVSVTLDEPEEFELDGDVVARVDRFECEILPKALMIRCNPHR